jgi:hypothetical protein
MLNRGGFLAPYAKRFFCQISGTVDISDSHIAKTEKYLQELEERDDIEVINGERAIEFGAGWGRLRYYLIRDRFGSVDLIDINNVMLD